MAEGEPTENVNSDSLLLGSESDFDIACQPCGYEGKNVEADGYCLDCCEYLCSGCYTCHRNMSISRHHKLVDKDNMPAQQGNFKVKDTCTERCPSHEDEIVKFFCPIHKELGCSVCVTINHTTCKVDYIADICKDFENSEDYTTFKTLLNKMIFNTENLIESATENTDTMTKTFTKVLQDIKHFRKEVIDWFNEWKINITNRITDIKKSEAVRIKAVSDAGTRVLEELQAMSSDCDKLVDQKHYCQMFTNMKHADTKLSELKDKLHVLDAETNRVTFVKFEIGEEMKSVMGKRDALGKVVEKCLNEIELAHVADLNVGAQSNRRTSTVSGIAILSKEKLVLTDMMNRMVKLCDTINRKVISELNTEDWPSDVTRISEDFAAVTLPDAHKVLVLRCDKTLVVNREIHVNGDCLGIDYSQEKLFLTYDDPSKVEIISMTGEVLQSFVTNDQGEELFSDPTYICVNINNQSIYVSDNSEHSVIQIDMEGNIMTEYVDDELSRPGKMAIDAFGRIYLCGENSSNIHLLTPECRKVKVISKEKDGLKWPRTVAFCDATDTLYIGMYKEDMVKVYKVQ